MGEAIEGAFGERLRDSEVRLKAALKRLEVAANASAGKGDRISALENEKKVLEEGLAGLKFDYESLERAFAELKKRYEAQYENGAATEPAEDSAESKSIRVELDRVRGDYDALERSFTLLKEQYLDLQNAHDGIAGSGQAVRETAKNNVAPPESARAFKMALASRLDEAIDRIGKIAAS